jgi:hypothetical protein
VARCVYGKSGQKICPSMHKHAVGGYSPSLSCSFSPPLPLPLPLPLPPTHSLACPWCSRNRCLSESESCIGLHWSQIILAYILLSYKSYQIGSSREFLTGTLLPPHALFGFIPIETTGWELLLGLCPVLAQCQEMLKDEWLLSVPFGQDCCWLSLDAPVVISIRMGPFISRLSQSRNRYGPFSSQHQDHS